jgi:hypothetical protein
MTDLPKPNIHTDVTYLAQVGSLIDSSRVYGDIHFEYLTNLVQLYYPGLDIYALNGKEEHKVQLQEIVENIFSTINRGDIADEVKDILHRLWDYLAESDPLEKADLIYVFGGISQLAVQHAIELQLQGYASKIMFSGKHASYVQGIEITEAEQYKRLALQAGVAEESILIEEQSINTPENIVFSKQLLYDLHLIPSSVIAVSLPYHMKRASLTMWAGFDWEPQIIRSPGKSAKYTRETYYTDIKGFSYVFFEYLKIHGARQMGHF